MAQIKSSEGHPSSQDSDDDGGAALLKLYREQQAKNAKKVAQVKQQVVARAEACAAEFASKSTVEMDRLRAFEKERIRAYKKTEGALLDEQEKLRGQIDRLLKDNQEATESLGVKTVQGVGSMSNDVYELVGILEQIHAHEISAGEESIFIDFGGVETETGGGAGAGVAASV
ncbi:hypothetical protein T439DRAFT_377135 [Meredithblackwellia eburnea MCA 4105]